MFPLTGPTLLFCADSAIFIAFQEKNKKIFIPTDPKMFQKIQQKNFEIIRIAQLMLRIIFFNFLDVLNFVICMFSGTVDDI